MLTIVNASDCANFTVTSDSSTTNLVSVTLEITHNCSKTITKQASTGPFTIVPADFGFDTKLCDGVYYISYTSSYTNNTKIKESKCHIVDCSLHCDVTKDYALSRDAESLRLYQIFKMAQDCSDCDCELLCDIYNELTAAASTTSNCGCS